MSFDTKIELDSISDRQQAKASVFRWTRLKKAINVTMAPIHCEGRGRATVVQSEPDGSELFNYVRIKLVSPHAAQVSILQKKEISSVPPI